MNIRHQEVLASAGRMSGIPQVTFGFWVIKTVATALGEVGGHAVGGTGSYLIAIACVASIGGLFAIDRYNEVAFWLVLLAVSVVSAALAHTTDHSLGIGDFAASLQLAALLVLALIVWFRTAGTIGIASIVSVRDKALFWIAVMLAQTFASALADWTIDPGQTGSAIVPLAVVLGLPAVAVVSRRERATHPALFWTTFVLTGILGALWGDLLVRLAIF
ncbi:hypothetical protein [Bradyrhizobium genosp. P]|uniref:hypothetical protein n=1 Tax=Bradyrhizobium genosp. P TaxID=83641 RepID=UPI003CF85838